MTLKKSLLSSLLLSACLSVAATSVGAAETLKLSHILDRTHPYHKAVMFFAKRVETLTGGEIKVRVYPNAELGKQREVLELIQNGSIAMGQANVASLEGFSKEYAAFSMPYLFKDKDHLYRAFQSPVAQGVLAGTESKGFLGIAFHESGARSFYGKKAFNVPADLKGFKIRVQPSPVSIRTLELLGAIPTPLEYGELYTALQQGVVDGAENNPTALTLSRHGEVAKFFSQDEHTMTPDVLVMSAKIWGKLSDKNKKAIKQAGLDSTLEMRKFWAATETVEIEKAKKMGVTFVTVDKTPFMQAVKPIYDELQTKDPEVSKIVKALGES